MACLYLQSSAEVISVALHLAVNLSSSGLRQLFSYDCGTKHSKNKSGNISEVLIVHLKLPTYHLSDLYLGELGLPGINTVCSEYFMGRNDSKIWLEIMEVCLYLLHVSLDMT